MKSLYLIFAAATLAAMANEASAEGAATATLQNPLAKPIHVIAGDAYWTCEETLCAAGAASGQSLSIDACRSIVKAAGPVTAYTVEGSSLRPTLLARCNAIAASH
jgi:hypothetical protein